MKKSILLLSFLIALSFNANAGQFQLDSSHSAVTFKVKHLMLATVTGRFNKFSGGFQFDEKTGKLQDVAATVDATTIDTNDPKRDEHLKSKDFFEVNTFKTLTFKGNKVDYKKNKPVAVHGDLTLHGVTKPVTLNLNYAGATTDPWGNKRVVFDANTKIQRKDFGLNWNKNLDAGGVVVGDEVTILIEGEAIEAKETATK